MTNDERGVLAERIPDTLDDLPLEALRALADGLSGADGPAGLFYLPVFYSAADRERGVERGFLAPGSMVVALAMGSERRKEFIARFENAARLRSGLQCATRCSSSTRTATSCARPEGQRSRIVTCFDRVPRRLSTE